MMEKRSVIVCAIWCGGLLAVSLGCSYSHLPDEGTDAGAPVEARTEDAGSPPDPSLVPLTQEEAECLGLIEPSCASCHIVSGAYVLRPEGDMPPPLRNAPPGPTPEECGVMP